MLCGGARSVVDVDLTLSANQTVSGVGFLLILFSYVDVGVIVLYVLVYLVFR